MQPTVLNAMFSSERMDWNTPQVIVDGLNAMGGVALDPCSNANSIVGARVEWRLSERALRLELMVSQYKEKLAFWSKTREVEAVKRTKENIKKAKKLLAECLADPAQTDNGLRDSWLTGVLDAKCNAMYAKEPLPSLVYVNPPYGSALADWSQKIAAEANAGLEIVALVPSRTDTDWFHTLWESARTTLLWKGRLKFLGADNYAVFPSALFYFGKREEVFIKAFADKGIFIQ
jgi:hypothetical protein